LEDATSRGSGKTSNGKRKRMGNVEKREGRGERERARQSEVEGFRKIGCKTRQDERGSERRDRERRRGSGNSFTFSRADLVSLESSFPFSFLLLPPPRPPPAHSPPPFSSVVMVGTWLKGTSHLLRWREKQRTARKSSPFQPSILLEPSSTSSKFYSLSLRRRLRGRLRGQDRHQRTSAPEWPSSQEGNHPGLAPGAEAGEIVERVFFPFRSIVFWAPHH